MGGGGGEKENLLYCTKILNPLKEDREKIRREGENNRKNKGEKKKVNFILYILLREIVREKREKKRATKKG